MGARAQVQVVPKWGEGTVFLYTHNDSGNLPKVVARGLDRGRGRWGDSEYLTRIIFNEMTRGREFEETGFGIGTSAHGDLDYPPIVVDDKTGTVTHGHVTCTYEEYVQHFS